MYELKVTDEIVDDIKDSIECHLGWFSTKIKVQRVSKRYNKLLRNLPSSDFLEAYSFKITHFYKLKFSEDNNKTLNETIFTSGCDDCDFESLHHKWRYLSAKDFVQTDSNEHLSQYLNK